MTETSSIDDFLAEQRIGRCIMFFLQHQHLTVDERLEMAVRAGLITPADAAWQRSLWQARTIN